MQALQRSSSKISTQNGLLDSLGEQQRGRAREGTKPSHVTPTSKCLVIYSRLQTILNVFASGLPYTWRRPESKMEVGILPKRSTVSLWAYSDTPAHNALAIPTFSTQTMPPFNHYTTLLTTYFTTCARLVDQDKDPVLVDSESKSAEVFTKAEECQLWERGVLATHSLTALVELFLYYV